MIPFKITLPIPDREVSQNARRGQSEWAAIKKSQIVKKHRALACHQTSIALRTSDASHIPLAELQAIQWKGYSLAFFFRTAFFRDEGNAEGSCKAYVDGICDALGIDDRNFNKVALTTRAKDAANPRVEITIY
jgi:hypothetical protein